MIMVIRKLLKKIFLGNTIIEDNNGNRKTVKKDIFGNTIIEDNKGHKQIIKRIYSEIPLSKTIR